MRIRLIAATLLAGGLFAADPGLVSLAMPDTRVMAGINLTQVLQSPLGQYQLAHGGLVSDAGLGKLTETAGFDPRRDLREILFCSNAQPASSSSIVLARGAFDIPRILEAAGAAGAATETYKGVSILGDKQGSLAFPDATLAMAGTAADVRAAIDRISAPTSISSSLAVQVNHLSTTEDVWVVSMAPLSQLQPQPPGADGTAPGPFAMLSTVQQASLGVKLGAIVAVSLQATCLTDQDAAALAQNVRSMAGAADLFLPKDTYVPAGALLKSLTATAEGPVMQVSLNLPEAQIDQMLQAVHANQSGATGWDLNSLAQPPVRDSTTTVEQSMRPAQARAVPQRIRVGGNVQKVKLLQRVEPAYPPLALQARIFGVVRLNAVIGKDGMVQKLTLASGHPLLVSPAMDAVRQWVYAPTLLNGQAVEVATQIEVEFRPDR